MGICGEKKVILRVWTYFLTQECNRHNKRPGGDSGLLKSFVQSATLVSLNLLVIGHMLCDKVFVKLFGRGCCFSLLGDLLSPSSCGCSILCLLLGFKAALINGVITNLESDIIGQELEEHIEEKDGE